MSQIEKVHGDYQPVVVFDSNVVDGGAGSSNGLNA